MSLIEIVVAVGILGAILMAFGALVRVGALGDESRDQSIALAAASSELESLRASGASALPASTTFSSSALSALPSGAGAIATSSNAGLIEVDVAVSWQELGGARSIKLSTLLAPTGGLP